MRKRIEDVSSMLRAPSILDEDRSPLNSVDEEEVEKYLQRFYDAFTIPLRERPLVTEARRFVIELSFLTQRHVAIQRRKLAIGSSVRYHSLPAITETFVIKMITDEFLIRLNSGQIFSRSG